MHKVVLAGSVTTTFTTLQALVNHGIDVAGVLGYEPENTSNVSGYVNMRDYCREKNLAYYPFKKIGAASTQQQLKDLSPDIFFVVGLSQLVPAEMLSIARLGNIGFHPTLLPKGRGRAPIAWLIMEETQGAANFFLMGEGADDGPVFVQEPFSVDPVDNARSIEEKINLATARALDSWLPKLKKGEWEPLVQDEKKATYYGKRGPEDGWINWQEDTINIDKLIRASSPPHPGAYSFLNGQKISILSCRKENDLKIKGVVGAVLLKSAYGEFLIQCGEGLLWIADLHNEKDETVELKVGQRLGMYVELEIHRLRKELDEIKLMLTKTEKDQ